MQHSKYISGLLIHVQEKRLVARTTSVTATIKCNHRETVGEDVRKSLIPGRIPARAANQQDRFTRSSDIEYQIRAFAVN